MHNKRHTEIKKLIENAGGELVGEIEINGAGHPTCVIKAPNGQTQKVSFGNTNSDWRTDANQQAYMSRFIKSNPGLEKPIVQALRKAVGATEFKNVPRLIAPPKPASIAEPPPPPVAPSFAKPSEFSSTKASTTTKTTPKKERNRLTTEQTLDLVDYLRTTYKWEDAKPWKYAQVAEAAYIALGFTISETNVANLCKRYNLRLYTQPLELLTTFTPEGAVQAIIHQLEALCKSSKVQPTAQFKALAESFAAGRGFKTR